MILGALLSSLLALANVNVTPERQVVPPRLMPQTSSSPRLNAASDGDGWLVVRAGGGGEVANRVDGDGNLIDQTPIALGGGYSGPAVAWGAGAYLAAWSESNSIRAALIDRDGHRSPVTIVSNKVDSTSVQQVACAFDGSRFLIVWSTYQQLRTSVIRGKAAAILDASGNVIATDIAVDNDPASERLFGLAAGNGEFLLVTTIGTRVFGTTIDDAGRAVRRVQIGTNGTYPAPVVAFDGSEYLVLWDSRGARVGATITPFSTGFVAQSLTWTGDHFIAISTTNGTVESHVIDANGVGPATPLAEAAATGGAAWNGRALLVPYVKYNPGSGISYATLTDGGGAPIDRNTILSLAPQTQLQPAIAADGAHDALVVWTSPVETSERFHAHAAHLRDGVPTGEPIDFGPTMDGHAAVAFGAAEYLVVTSTWTQTSHTISGRRVARDGTPIDAVPFDILTAYNGLGAEVAFDGRNFVVAGMINRNAADFRGSVVAVRVRPDGTVVDAEPIVIDAPQSGARIFDTPLIASGGAGSLVVWKHDDNLITAALSQEGVPTFAIHLADRMSGEVSVGWGDGNYIVDWVDLYGHALRWIPIDVAGLPTGTSGSYPLTAIYQLAPPTTTPFGGGALIAWVEMSAPPNTNLRGLRVDAYGAQEGDAFTIAATEFTENQPALAPVAGGARVVYERGIDYPGFPTGLPRVFTRTIENAPSPGRRRAAR